MKKFLNKCVLTIVVGLMSLSCEKVIHDPKIEQQPPLLVVYALLSPEKIFEVYVSRSISILDINGKVSFDTVSQVVIFENKQVIDTLVFQSKTMSYVSKVGKTPKPGNTYTVEVSSTDFSKAVAETYIPQPVGISKVEFSSNKLRVFIDDPISTDNYYLLCVYYMNASKNDYDDPYQNLPDSFLIHYTTRNQIIELFSSSSTNFIDFQLTSHEDGIDYENDYRVGADKVVFSDATFNGKQLTLDLENIDYKNIQIGVYLTNLSVDYYYYIRSRAAYKDFDDFISERVAIYSNVKNGYGFVIGMSHSKYYLYLNN